MFGVGFGVGLGLSWGMNLGLTPAGLGFRMPAEWEVHSGTWLTWPRPEGISFPDKYETVPDVYAELIKALVQVESVHINVWNAE
jgi:agmatine deiminase